MDGHWVAITKNNGEISFFDPYGEVIDKQLKYSNYSKQRVQGEGDTSLHNLLSTSKLPVYFNDYKYQRDGGGVNTCGRHVVNFIRYNLGEGLDLEDYNEMMMKRASADTSLDEIANARALLGERARACLTHVHMQFCTSVYTPF